MNYYYICEGEKEGEYNATSKARNDVEEILEKNKYKKFFIPTKKYVQKNKIKKIYQVMGYLKNYFVWQKKIKSFSKEDTVVIQYPLINTTINFKKILRKLTNNSNTIVLIHDMDSLRYRPEAQGKILCERIRREDQGILKEAGVVISHNEEMSKKLIEYGVNGERIVNLNIFDYLYDKKIVNCGKLNQRIIIAGNLSPEKSKYITKLKTLKNINFNLYGLGYENDNSQNVMYKGSFKPEELLENLDGQFGLVWDGESIEGCFGGFGEYLEYNNPHKASMYIAANIPIIIWKEAAMAKFIEKNDIGYTIKKLSDIEELLKKITTEEYNKKLNNIKQISSQIRSGYYLESALLRSNEIEKEDE